MSLLTTIASSSSSTITTLTTIATPLPPPALSQLVTATSTTTQQQIRSNHGDNRLKSCQIASNISDNNNRTSSKVNVNRTALVSSSLVSIKTSEKNNIPNASDNNACSSSDNNKLINNNNNKTTIATVIQQVRDVKSISSSSSSIMVNNSEKINSGSEKVLCRRDSNGGSPRTPSSSAADIRGRRNSETNNPRRIEDTDKFNCNLIDPRTESEEQRKKERLEKIRLENERMEREKAEKERIEKERIEKERQEKELLEKERLEKERLERESELEKQRLEKERLEKERIERERAEKEEREKRREEQERQREREEKERREREEREKREREEKEERERIEKEKQLERERKRDDERRHKEDNHRHRENHSENKHNHIEKTNIFEKNTKESVIISDKIKEDNKHESSKSSHEKSVRHHSDRDSERRKDSIKENRDNNIHDKHKNFNDIKENKEVRSTIESRHMSIEMDKSRSFENALLNKPQDPNKRKERNNSLPANIGSKRRLSSHESDNMDENKRIKLNQDHKKLSERRDSKDSTRSDKTKHKNNSISSKTHDEKQRQKDKEREERHKNKQHKLDKQKAKSKSREKDSRESPSTPKSPLTDKDFLGRLELRSTEDMDNKQLQRKDSKEKRDIERDEKKMEERKKEKQEKSSSKQREETKCGSNNDERKTQRKDRIRKITQNSSDNTDSDEPKKHSIFDIVDDEPAYISMYDKVKARSCKNMQKQEEEKRQEKIKAKFSQLKQSRAKREEKKRSTSWDEDSDSDRERIDKSEIKMKRVPKIIASSDDEEMERKVHKKKEIYTDSDSDRHRQIKMENIETSDDDRIRTKNQPFKSSKSRITSDTSDDEFKKIQTQIKNEIYSDNEQNFADSEEKPFKVKEELDRLIKKERRNNKHQESIAEQIFGDSNSPIPEKQLNNRLSFADNSTDDEMVKKERSESRKKHKKKQKRQKHSMSSEESCKLEMVIDSIQNECLSEKSKHHDKKKQHSKKDKKRDKSKDERDKTKKSKKNKSDSKSDLLKRDGKMENIFGSLSEDSESGMKESEDSKLNSYKFNDEGVQSSLYNSESDRELEHKIYNKHEDKEQRQKDEHKKHKEKKRREKERRLQEAAAVEINENSLDYADMGKQLEANIKDESTDIIEEMTIKTELENNDTTEEPFRFGHNNDVGDYRKDKESKEKKKKRKKSKEEKQKHHHHHHHDKNKIKSPEIKKPLLTEEIKIEIDEQKTQNQSLPNILDIPSPENTNKSSSTNLDYSISPVAHEPMISPIPKTPTSSKEKKRDKLIPGFGGDIDEKIHESAVKSISDFESSKEEVKTEETKTEKPTPPSTEEKPRVIISQEETEDAVAALLGESFGENQFEDCYNEEITTNNDQSSNLTEENNVQDDEEMRQAVQSLSTTDLDVKPDTPLSENELQIDTDTEEQDDISLRYDQPPKTPDMNDLLRPPKTPDLPSYMRNNEETNKSNNNVKTTVPNSPPSLTPIKPTPPSPPPLVEVKKPTETKEIPKSLPLLSEARSVISKSWSTDNKVQNESPITTNTSIRAYNTPPMVKISESQPYPASLSFSKQSPPIEANKVSTMTVLQTFNKSPTNLHTLPARSPIQINKQQQSPTTITEAPKSTQINRLPITSVTVSKPIQPTTVILPQSKIAHTLEPPKLVSTLDPKPAQQQRMILQSAIQPNQFNYQNKSHLVQGLLIPSKVPPTSSYNYVPQTVPSLSVLVKDSVVVSEKSVTEMTTTSSTTTTATTVTSTPSIIVSSSNATQMPVIQEAPPAKLIQFPSTTRPKNVIQQTPPTAIVPELPQTESNDNLLKVENRTSTPSPVIVQNPKEQLGVVVEKKEEPVEEPTKLAIATVTEELNLSLKKDEPNDEEPPKEAKLDDVKVDVKDEPKPEPEEKIEPAESVSVIKETEKFDEEKADMESIVSDISKERSSADILTKDDALDNKEDSDYWSAKEVNIDSVIKTLCSADELSDHSSEIGKDEWFDETTKPNEVKIEEKDTKKKDDEVETKQQTADDMEQLDEGVDDEEKELSQRGKRVSRGRGRKSRGSLSDRGGIQTRRGKLVKDPNNTTQTTTTTTTAKRGSGRGGRGGGRGDRKSSKSESENSSTDVYEFRDDTDENNVNKERPRLILTIKSPAVASATNNQTTAIVKEVIKDGCKEIIKEVKEPIKEEPTSSPPVQQQQPQSQPQNIQQQTTTTKPNDTKEEFISPTVNTRKSKRLQERDGSRNTVDDTIEDVVRNTVQTRAAAAAAANTNGPRRSGRQPVPKVQLQETPRKSPRGGGRKKDRRASECTDDSSEEKSKEIDLKQQQQPSPIVETPKEMDEKVKEVEKEIATTVQAAPPPPPQPVKEKPHEGLKAAMLRRIKGEMNHEPTNLIDPVTGLLTPMRESEEGGYIPLPNEQRMLSQKATTETKQTSVIQQQQSNVVQQQKPQSLKAHVLSSQAAKAVVQQHQQQQQQQAQPKATTIQTSIAPQTIISSKPVTPISQHLSVNVAMSLQQQQQQQPAHLSPRPQPLTVNTKQVVKVVKSQQMSPTQLVVAANPQQQQQPVLQVCKTATTPAVPPKAHISSQVPQQQPIVNTQMAHIKPAHQPVHKQQQQQQQQQVIRNMPKSPHSTKPQLILTGSVASPPLKAQSLMNPTRIIQAPPPPIGAKVKEPPKVDVSLPNMMLNQRTTLSPQGPASRHVGQAGLPPYEASLVSFFLSCI